MEGRECGMCADGGGDDENPTCDLGLVMSGAEKNEYFQLNIRKQKWYKWGYI